MKTFLFLLCFCFASQDQVNSSIANDCQDWQGLYGSGERTIELKSTSQSVQIYCDQDTEGGRWNVFQRRKDGSVDFFKVWSDYRNGFGDPEGEFWLGLETLHQMTSDGRRYDLRFDMERQDGSKRYAIYNDFRIDSESEGYAVHFTGFRGNFLNYFAFNSDMKFSTIDRDQDSSSSNCARLNLGAWWYNRCGQVNLNGPYNVKYKYRDYRNNFQLLRWNKVSSQNEVLKKTEIKFRVR